MTQSEDSRKKKDDTTTGGLNAQSSGMLVDAGVKSALKLKFRMKRPPISEQGEVAATGANFPLPDAEEPQPGAEKTDKPVSCPADQYSEVADTSAEPVASPLPPRPTPSSAPSETEHRPPEATRPGPVAVPPEEGQSAVIATEDGRFSYRFRRPEKTETDQPTAPTVPSEEKAAVEKESTDGRPAVFAAMFFFLCGISFYALAFYKMGTPVTDLAPTTRLTILAVQLVFTILALPSSRLPHICARIMAGAATLLAALTAIGVFAFENFLASNLAVNLVGELPSVTLASVASLVFAASLALLARNATSHWLIAGFCLLGGGGVYLFPLHQLVDSKHVAGRVNELLAGEMDSLPGQWALLENRLADGGGLHFRHRLAPLEARLAPAAGSRFSLATVETVGKRLQEEHRQRAGFVACILSTVDSKPHQLRLLSLGKEKTVVLIVQTSSGVQTLTVSGKQEIFDRYEGDVQKLFAIMD